MTDPSSSQVASPGTDGGAPYASSVDDCALWPGVDPARGLSTTDVQERMQRYGTNELAEKKKESGWQAFLRQYRDFMQIVLLTAALINVVVKGDWSTTLVLVGLTVFNAVLSLRGESKAEARMAALAVTMKSIARVRCRG